MSKPLLRVSRWNKPNAYASVEEGATKGADLGVNLYLNGVLVRPEDVLNIYASPGDGGTEQFPITYWRLIQEIPPNVTALANTGTTGIYVVTGPGTSATRGLLPGPGINITFSNGVAGDPTIAHADTSSVANISASFTGSTVPGEISFTFDQFGHVLTRTITGRQLDHNDLGALQGGAPGQYYHLTESERDSVNTAVQSVVAGDGIAVDDTVVTAPVVTNTDKGSVAVAAHVAEADPHPQYLTNAEASAAYEPIIAAGTTGQFWRGDKSWGNYVSGSMGAGGAWLGDASLLAGANTGLWAQSDSVPRFVAFRAADAGTGAQFIGARSGGTAAAQTNAKNGTPMFELYGSAYNGSAWTYPASLVFFCAEDQSTTARGSRVEIRTTSNGTTALVPRLHIGRAGTANVEPGQDNVQTFGSSVLRWSEIFAVNGAINTSDAREKTVPRLLTEQELAAALDIARLPSVFQWLHALAEKGESARLHCSPAVQSVIATMQAHELDPFRYGFVCYDQWDEQPEVLDGETGKITQEYRAAGDRYSLRPSELAHFIAAAIVQRQDSIEQRLAALEGA